MPDAVNRMAAFVEALLNGRRPPRFPVECEDGGLLRVAAAICAATPGSDTRDRC